MRIVGTQKKQDDGNAEQELLSRCILRAVIDLLPHVQVVISAAVEVERNTADPMEHDVGAEHVADIGKRPGRLLGHAGDDIPEDL